MEWHMSEVRAAEKLNEPSVPTQGAIDFITSNLADLFARIDPETGITLSRLVSLLDEEETDDYGILRPTLFAFITALELIAGASLLMSSGLPRATPCTDEQGGIRFEWSRPAREVGLVVPAHQGGRMYIYHAHEDKHELEDQVSASTLANWLRWLVGDA
jgi:hypothetical protein